MLGLGSIWSACYLILDFRMNVEVSKRNKVGPQMTTSLFQRDDVSNRGKMKPNSSNTPTVFSAVFMEFMECTKTRRGNTSPLLASGT